MNEDMNLTPEPEEEIRSIFDDPELFPPEEELPTEELPEEEDPFNEGAEPVILPVEAEAEPRPEEETGLFPQEEPVTEEEIELFPGDEEIELFPEDEEIELFPGDEEIELFPGDEEIELFPGEEPVRERSLLEDPLMGEEIGADETAVIGLSRHGDAELEQIIRETNAEETHVISFPEPEPMEEEEEPQEVKPVKKRRPKMKKGYGLLGIPHVVATAVWLAIILLIGVTLGRMGWIAVSEVLAFGKPDSTIVVSISNGDNIDTVTAKLKAAGLIRYPELFKKYAELTKADEDISAGTFTLNTKYDYFALVKAMSYHSPARETIELVIPEGYTCAQIFELLEKNDVCTVAELEEYAANGEIKERWFLEGLERGDKYCLEGYLFPAKYEFYTDDTPGRVIGKFLDGFDSHFTDIMKERIDSLNERMSAILRNRGYEESVIEERKFTIRDIIIIASMIERETSNDAESYEISSVIYNRLTNPANFPYLNIDATLIYALGGNIDPETGKTKPLTSEDLQMEHPYNTYTVKGLIPGPISNPGRNSLNAALDPSETDYYFYVYNPKTFVHLFAETAKGHEKNVEEARREAD